MSGTVDILNTGAGHMQLRFDKSDPIEADRARRVVTDMLRKGFALFVEIGELEPGRPNMVRVEAFDAERDVYVIADVPTEIQGDWDAEVEAARAGRGTFKVDEATGAVVPAPQTGLDDGPKLAKASRDDGPNLPGAGNGRRGPRGPYGKRGRRAVPAASVKATAVGRTAGG
jgi:hypothetical protein